jgi:hypothetical protein
MAVDLVWLGIALLLAPVFGEFSKIRNKAGKGFEWLAGAGVLYLLAAAFMYDIGYGTTQYLTYGTVIFSIIGLIATLVGAIIVIANLFK